MGWPAVHGIVKRHGGFIYVYSEPGRGTSFRVYLQAEEGVHAPRGVALQEKPLRGSEMILVADDHEGLRDSANEMLQALGNRTLLACDGAEAFEMFKANSQQIDLILVDVVMPRLSGPEAYAQIAKLRPDAKVIFTTGYTSEAAALMTLLEKGSAILQKPFGMTALSQMVRSTLDRKMPTEKLQIS